MRVPLQLMDSVDSRDRAAIERAKRSTSVIVDGTNSGGVALNRPGFRQDATVADARQRVRDEYRNYENYITGAWRNTSRDRMLMCVADNPRAGGREDPRDGMTVDAKTQAYLDYDLAVSQQWATGKGKPAVRDALPARVASRGGATSKDEAYAKYDQDLEAAYRNPPSE